MAQHDQERVVIAVLTYRRPGDLQALLPLLVDQAAAASSANRTVEVLVVDNDVEPSARGVTASATADAPAMISVRYEHESVPGISAARNRALDAAAGSDLLVFIDDDERPTPDWLANLLATRQRYNADVVQGPVVSQFDVEPDSWIRSGGFFNRRRMPTGTALDVAVTNNLLLDVHAVRRAGVRFDPDLGSTGGEDTLFTRMLFRAGLRMVWCAEAVVVDIVPAARASRQWVTQRAISTGNTAAVVALKLAPGPVQRGVARARLTAQGGIRLAGGLGQQVVGKATGSERHHARGTRTLLRGLGMTIGAWGFVYHEYGRTEGARISRARSKPASTLRVPESRSASGS